MIPTPVWGLDCFHEKAETLSSEGGADPRSSDAIRFRDLLTIPYGPLADGLKDFRIYTVLGNHDWHTSREGAMAQVRFTLASRVGRHGGRTHRDNRRVRKRRNASSASGMSASSGNG
jgi:hypothetical protein